MAKAAVLGECGEHARASTRGKRLEQAPALHRRRPFARGGWRASSQWALRWRRNRREALRLRPAPRKHRAKKKARDFAQNDGAAKEPGGLLVGDVGAQQRGARGGARLLRVRQQFIVTQRRGN